MMMQLQPPLMTEERVPGEELEGIACMQSLAEEPEPPRHAEPSPAVLKALELAAARRSTGRSTGSASHARAPECVHDAGRHLSREASSVRTRIRTSYNPPDGSRTQPECLIRHP